MFVIRCLFLIFFCIINTQTHRISSKLLAFLKSLKTIRKHNHTYRFIRTSKIKYYRRKPHNGTIEITTCARELLGSVCYPQRNSEYARKSRLLLGTLLIKLISLRCVAEYIFFVIFFPLFCFVCTMCHLSTKLSIWNRLPASQRQRQQQYQFPLRIQIR